jgi:hypothetical protein
MKERILVLVCSVLLSVASFANAEDPVHEVALFMKNALDFAAPVAYWIGDAEHPPTFYFHMLHQPWQTGNDAVKSEGARLLGCAAPVVGRIFDLAGGRLPEWNNSHYRYRVLVSPPPPGGAVMVAAEGVVKPEDCAPSVEAQKLFLRVLFPAEKLLAL